MAIRIRDYEARDLDAVVALSLRAWAPVFDSVEGLLGDELARRLHGPDWRDYQANAVTVTLTRHRSWVATDEGEIVGFAIAAVADADQALGEIVMLAVDPPAQRHGAGLALAERATEWLRARGMKVAMIGTGGDPGHAPARELYERAGYRPLPLARYFKAL